VLQSIPVQCPQQHPVLHSIFTPAASSRTSHHQIRDYTQARWATLGERSLKAGTSRSRRTHCREHASTAGPAGRVASSVQYRIGAGGERDWRQTETRKRGMAMVCGDASGIAARGSRGRMPPSRDGAPIPHPEANQHGWAAAPCRPAGRTLAAQGRSSAADIDIGERETEGDRGRPSKSRRFRRAPPAPP
jgi:hypothetical protein